MDVQVGGGLVQEQDARLLGQRPGHKHPLALSARERGERPVGESFRLGQPHGLQGDAPVGGPLHLKAAHLGIAAHEHYLQAGKTEGKGSNLGHVCLNTCHLAGRHPLQVAPFQGHRSLLRAEEA